MIADCPHMFLTECRCGWLMKEIKPPPQKNPNNNHKHDCRTNSCSNWCTLNISKNLKVQLKSETKIAELKKTVIIQQEFFKKFLSCEHHNSLKEFSLTTSVCNTKVIIIIFIIYYLAIAEDRRRKRLKIRIFRHASILSQ